MTQNPQLKKQEIKAIIKQINVSEPEERIAKIFIHLILMPLSGCFGLAVLTYFLSSTPLAFFSAFLFIFSFCGWVTLWVLKHIHKVRSDYTKAINKIKNTPSLAQKEVLHKKATMILTKSFVIYTLVVGYLLVAFGFAVVYDALKLSNESGLFNNLYLSISTITTIGYGDVVPTGAGRFFAALEMIYAILYQVLAVSVGTTYLIRLTEKN